ncbi:MAG: calcium-binding protein, partial [Selenomonadaceae bacterium]|nr:calcium-binding protein [Selenomonadaceae bacterium]
MNEIENTVSGAKVIGTSGADSIRNATASAVTIRASGGADIVINGGAQSSLDGGKGNDTIINEGTQSSISGGAGNDQIALRVTGNLIEYAAGDGNDTIFGFNESDTLSITGADFTKKARGSDVIVTVGKNKIVLVGAKGKAFNVNKSKGTDVITLTEGNDVLVNDFNNVTINALGGDDTLQNIYGDAKLSGGAGADYIYNSANGTWATLSGDDENDTLVNYAWGAQIFGGAGNDLVVSGGYNHSTYGWIDGGDLATISGGAGADTIVNNLGAEIFIEYADGDGNDSIVGFNDTSTLHIAASKYSTKKSGDDLIVTVGKGKITLAGAASLSANISFDKLLTVDDETSSPVTVDSKTKIIDGTSRTKAIKITGNKLANT